MLYKNGEKALESMLSLKSNLLTINRVIFFVAFSFTPVQAASLYVMLDQHPWTTAITPYIPEFEKQTGIKVNIKTFPESEYRDKVLNTLRSSPGSVDVFMMTPNQEGPLLKNLNLIENLDSYINSSGTWDWNDFYPSTRQATQLNGNISGVPVQLETTLLFYRKDIFYKYGIAVPQTLNQLEAAAKALNGKDGMVGIALRGKGSSATSQFAPYLYGLGGQWLTSDGQANFTNPQFSYAFKKYIGLLRQYGPQGSEKMSWPEITKLFADGKVAMFTDASVFRSVVEDPKTSSVVGKVGFAPFPMGVGGRKANVLVWTLAMSRTSQNKTNAWKFMQWASNKQNQLRVLLKDVPTPRQSAWTDPVFRQKDLNPDWTRVQLQQLNTANPLWNPPVLQVSDVRNALGNAIVGSIQGGNIDQLLSKANSEADNVINKGK